MQPNAKPFAKYLHEERNQTTFREHDGTTMYRTWYQHDIDEIIYSVPFRRLSFKSQLITPVDENGRTRMVHTLDVNRIAVHLAESFGLCPQLAEAIALGHDLGQTPFGKACSTAFDEIEAELKTNNLVAEDFSLFSHEEYSGEIAEKIGERIINANSINGEDKYYKELVKICKHQNKKYKYGDKPFETTIIKSGDRIIEKTLTEETLEGIRLHNKSKASKRPSRLEVQIVQLADDISYILQDIGDGIKANLLTLADLNKFKNVVFKIMSRSPGERYRGEVDIFNICSLETSKRFDVMIRRTIDYNIKTYSKKKEKEISLDYDPVLKEIIDTMWKGLISNIHKIISPSFNKAKYDVKFLFKQLLMLKSLTNDTSLHEFIATYYPKLFSSSKIDNVESLLQMLARYIAYMTDSEFLEQVDLYFKRTIYEKKRSEPRKEFHTLRSKDLCAISNVISLN